MYNFTMDFNCGRGAYANINHLVNTYGIPNTVVEIGIFEGSTTFWISDELTKYNEKLKIYAIDPHVGSIDLPDDPNLVHKNFMHNLHECKNKNVSYIRKHSEFALLDLIYDGVKAELIYIDGDHRASEVLTDLVLSWKILVKGGVILCDDASVWKYTDQNGTSSAQMAPKMAVDAFIQCNWHKLNIIHLPDMSQTAFIKL